MKLLKYALAFAGAFVLIAAIVAVWLVATFDVRDYEPRIVALVKEKTGRTLIIRGESKLALWPDLGLTLGPVALTERDSAAIFAEVANARLVAKLRPLLSKELVADELHLEGASVRITRYADGHFNVDDLLSGESAALDFDIAKARIERSRLVYEDIGAGTRHELTDLKVVTGRLKNGVATPLEVSFKAGDGERYALSSTLRGRLTFDRPQRSYTLQAANVRLEGKLGDVTGLAATITGNASVRDGALQADAVTMEVRGAVAERGIDGTVSVARLTASGGGIIADTVAVAARSPRDALQARVTSPRIEWRDGAAVASEMAMELDFVRDARTVHATVAAALRARDGGRAIDLADVRAKIVATGAHLPRQGVEAAFAGAGEIDLRSERANAKLAGTVLDSRVKATVSTTGFSRPSYTFAVDVETLDLDRIGTGADNGKSGIDLAALSNIRANGTLRIRNLKSAGIVAKNVQLAMKP